MGGQLQSKQQLMRGQGKNLIGNFQPTEPVGSSYQHTFKGMQSSQLASVKLDMHTSCSTNNIVPDPNMMRQSQHRLTTFKRDLRRVGDQAKTMLQTYSPESHRPATVFTSPDKLKYWK